MLPDENELTGYVAIGSNIAPRENIPMAIDLLGRQVTIEGVSCFYTSKALNRPEQPDFLNGVVRIRTRFDALALKFDVLREIEASLGRTRGHDTYAARCIDLDIAILGDVVVDEKGIRIPDPDIRTRSFVAVPLLELAPSLVIPGTNERLEDLPIAHDLSELVLDEELTYAIRAKVTRG